MATAGRALGGETGSRRLRQRCSRRGGAAFGRDAGTPRCRFSLILVSWHQGGLYLSLLLPQPVSDPARAPLMGAVPSWLVHTDLNPSGGARCCRLLIVVRLYLGRREVPGRLSEFRALLAGAGSV